MSSCKEHFLVMSPGRKLNIEFWAVPYIAGMEVFGRLVTSPQIH